MNAKPVRIAALAAVLAVLPASRAAADEPAPSALALPAPAVATAAPQLTLAEAQAAELSLTQPTLPSVELAGVHYRPRRSGWGNRALDAQSVSQIHLGFFDPKGDASRQFLMGIRGGPMIDSHLQLGVGVDWSHMANTVNAVSHTSTGPGGLPITSQVALSRSTSNLFPILAYVQVNGDDNMQLIPYVGLGGGYEVMNLTADNYQTGASFDATYGGWGWQVWGGAAYPLSGRSRITGELYLNTADLGRDVTDSASGITYRETVSADGFGMRFGVAWGF